MILHRFLNECEMQRRLIRIRDEREPLRPATLILLGGDKYRRHGRRIEREQRKTIA